MGCFGNSIIVFNYISMIERTTLKSHVPLCELFYLYVFKLLVLKLQSTQQN